MRVGQGKPIPSGFKCGLDFACNYYYILLLHCAYLVETSSKRVEKGTGNLGEEGPRTPQCLAELSLRIYLMYVGTAGTQQVQGTVTRGRGGEEFVEEKKSY